jgi:putative DNA primase/helicase
MVSKPTLDQKTDQREREADGVFISPELQPEGGAAQSRPRALFATAKSEPTGGAIILDRAEPYEIAKEFIRRKYWKHGYLGLYYKGETFWQFNGSFYEELEFDVLSAELYGFINAAKQYYRNNTIPIIVKPDDVANVMKCIKAGTTIRANLPQPCWIESEKPAPELFAFKNKLVNVRTGETLDPTPELWITDAVHFNFDPDAECPRWKKFLKEIHPNDPDAQNCIEEQLGYGMTYDMQFEKIAVWIGKSRAGKSTLLHVQRGLIGKRSFAPMSFNDWMRGEKSRENLIGKKVLAFSDVRLKRPKVYGSTGYDPGGLDHGSIQALLNISGRDSGSIGRMYKKAWEGELTCKIIITSNDPLNIHDPILLTRLVMVDFQQSWLNRPDRDDYLRDKLDAELPGIANRCLTAYRRLLGRKRFIQPASATRLARQIAAQTNPVAAFMQEVWVRDQHAKGPLAVEVYNSFKMWCEDHRRNELLDTYPRSQELMKAIRDVDGFSWLKDVRPHGDVRRYPGIRWRTKEDRKKEEEVKSSSKRQRRLRKRSPLHIGGSNAP